MCNQGLSDVKGDDAEHKLLRSSVSTPDRGLFLLMKMEMNQRNKITPRRNRLALIDEL